MPHPDSVRIARHLGVSRIDSTRSTLHAARAEAEFEAQADVVEALLNAIGLSPTRVAQALAARARIQEEVKV